MIVKTLEVGGKTIKLETGRYAKQANGAVMISCGDNYVLCTATAKPDVAPGQDWFPLKVDFKEKVASVGRIPGGFFKREGRPTEKEILSSRLIDRPIRPMFPEGFFNEVELIAGVYSADGENDADVLGTIGCSAALLISDIPFDIAVTEVRVGRKNGEYILNPSHSDLLESDFDIVVAGTEDSILMVEGECKEISEEVFLEAVKYGHKYIAEICKFQMEFAKEAGKKKQPIADKVVFEDMEKEIHSHYYEKIKKLTATILTKEERHSQHKELSGSIVEALKEKYPDNEKHMHTVMHDIQYEVMRSMILDDKKRLDGRKTTDIREITCEIGVLPRTHGSALFTRGQTQSLTTVTLGTKSDAQMIEGLKDEFTKRFILHYNFPAFSTGEVGGRPGPGRREIGHGNLAERSLKGMVPADFPYTIRIVSDVLESNGSSSMATVCAGSLAMMEAGVQVKKSVAGIAMGLIKEGDKVAILSDILGDEDHFGDMDFKVAGTTEGITAIQMDIKIRGIDFDIVEKALAQAKEGRMHILGIMDKTISATKSEMSPYAPRLYTLMIPTDMIGTVIGPGGKMIRSIVADSGAEIDIDDTGKLTVAAVNEESAEKALRVIRKLVEIPEVGKVYDGTVKSIKDFGAFVEILPGKEGLLHISEVDHKRLKKVDEVLKVGEAVKVKLIGFEDNGKFKLSRKALLPKPESTRPEAPKTEAPKTEA